MKIEEENKAFVAQLPELLKKNRGMFVLFHDGKVVDILKTHEEAYSKGIEKFGLETFLVDQIIEREVIFLFPILN